MLRLFPFAPWLLAFAPLAGAQDMAAVQIATGLDRPVFLVSPPGEADRLFVIEQQGRVRIIESGTLLPAPFLDLSPVLSQGAERGLLGLAFHPDYGTNGRFFVSCTNVAGDSLLLEFSVTATDPNIASPVPSARIFQIPQPYENHNAGCLQFGPDGYLYMTLGDGGGVFDPGGNAQDLTNAHGSLLRFDIDATDPYLPASQPFGGPGIEPAIFAYGLRNPWRFSFDRATGDLWLGDVGQFDWEEVNRIPAGSPGGQNFGWRCVEGPDCTGQAGCLCPDVSLSPPVHAYAHSVGSCSITGGYMYRGTEIPELRDRYVFGDFCSSKIWSMAWDGTRLSDLRDHTQELEPAGSDSIITISSFGEDNAGELYVCDYSGGSIYRIESECSAVPYCASTPNSTGFAARIGSNGSPSVSAGDFELEAWGLPPGSAGIFFYGLAAVETPLADGFLCVGSAGGVISRFPVDAVPGNGRVTRPLDFGSAPAGSGPGAIQPWTSTYFQFWYRDAGASTGANLTRGLRVSFCP